MLLEHIVTQVESIQAEMELMRNNNVNIKYAMSDIEKIKEQLEVIKDKVRANGVINEQVVIALLMMVNNEIKEARIQGYWIALKASAWR